MAYNNYDELNNMIRKIIRDESKYYVPRIGQVSSVEDELGKGRILITIPMFGWDTQDKAVWCYPKDKKALITPAVDDWVLVEFIDGHRDRAVYSGMAFKLNDMIPNGYTDKNTQVIFESNNKEMAIVYNESDKKLQIGAADESYVRGDTTKTELQKNIDALTQLQADFNSWTPVPNDGGAALRTILLTGFLTKAIASLTNMLSETIKGE